MKEEEIKIRISEALKKDFQEICESDETTMSNKINTYIVKEVNENKLKDIEGKFSEFLTTMGFNNITIIKNSNTSILTNDGPKTYFTLSYRGDFIEFTKINKDKQIYLYLLGSDIINHEFRAIVI